MRCLILEPPKAQGQKQDSQGLLIPFIFCFFLSTPPTLIY